MNAATFDTHAAVVALRAAGLDEAPAVAIVNTVRDVASADHADLATKADIVAVRSDLATAIADLKADMFKVTFGIVIGIVIANATLTAVFVFGALRLLRP